MNAKSVGVIVLIALVVASCGQPTGNTDPVTVEANEPVLQITSEGGFAPVELILNAGPRYTLLGDGRMIYRGAQTMEFPGALLTPYLIGQLSDEQVAMVIDLVVEIGLPDIDEEYDDTAARFVADATTEVALFWDEDGRHRFGVYALGIQESPSARNEAFSELIETLDEIGTDLVAVAYRPERVRVIAGPGFINEDFEDVREWPLDTGPSTWATLPNGWNCQVMDDAALETLADATQVTVWQSPDDEADLIKLLARPLHPGEPDCP